MKNLIIAYIINLVEDGETNLKSDDIYKAADFVWKLFDRTDLHDQIEKLLDQYQYLNYEKS